MDFNYDSWKTFLRTEIHIEFFNHFMNFQMFKLVLEKAEEPEIKLSTTDGSSKKQESTRTNIYFCFIDYAKAFDCGFYCGSQ